MSRENLEVVRRAIAAVNERDIDSYLPAAPTLKLERVHAVGADRVVAFLRATASGRASG